MTDDMCRSIRTSDDLTDRGVISLANEVRSVTATVGIVMALSFVVATFGWGVDNLSAAIHEHQLVAGLILLPLIAAVAAGTDIVQWLGLRRRAPWLRRFARSRYLTRLNKAARSRLTQTKSWDRP